MKHYYFVIATAPGPGAGGGMSIFLQFLDALKCSLVDNNLDEEWHVFVDDGMPMPSIQRVHYHVCHTKGVGRIWFDLIDFNI